MQIEFLEDEPFIAELWSIDNEIGHVRSEGLHVSKIIYAEAEEQGRSRANSAFTDSDLEAFRAMGFLWERVFELVMKRTLRNRGAIFSAPEQCMDGVYLTPDFCTVNGELVVEETKCTTRSAKMDVESNEEWFSAIKAYCRSLSTLKANLRVLHLRGYLNPPIPKLKQYKLVFTPSELEENWLRLINFAKAKGWL